MDDLETVFDSGTNGQKKNLVRMLVKEVVVHSRDEAEVWFAFPRPQEAVGNDVAGTKGQPGPHREPRFGHWQIWLPK